MFCIPYDKQNSIEMKRKYSSKRSCYSKKRKYSKTKRTSMARLRKRRFTARIKSLIHRTAETKSLSSAPVEYVFDNQNFNMSTPQDIMERLTMEVGPSDGQRVGQKITTKSCRLKMIVRAPPPDIDGLDNRRQSVAILQIFIGYNKESPSTPPTEQEMARIFDRGQQVTAANGTVDSLQYNINREQFRILYYKKVKVGNRNAADFANNDFPAYRLMNLNLTKFMGTLQYPGNLNAKPTNKHLFIFCNWVDPSERIGGRDNSPRLNWYLDHKYSDQ